MRCRLSTGALFAVAAIVVTAVSIAASSHSGGTEGGTSQFAESGIDDDGTEAYTLAAERVTQRGTQRAGSTTTAGSSGGGGSTSSLVCQYTQVRIDQQPSSAPGEPPPAPVTSFSPVSTSDLQAIYDFTGQPVRATLYCEAPGAEVLPTYTDLLWSPSADGSDPILVDPAVLAEIALSRLVFPPPVASTTPDEGEGTYAQLPTFFYVENWEPVSTSASAGSVTSTVTATPIQQTWAIRDTYGPASETVTCDGPGAPFDPAKPLEAQLPPECGWTPRHSSAGQTARGGARGEPCFPTTVTLSWEVVWTSNIGVGGDLGEGSSSADVCLVVAELQALVTADGR